MRYLIILSLFTINFNQHSYCSNEELETEVEAAGGVNINQGYNEEEDIQTKDNESHNTLSQSTNKLSKKNPNSNALLNNSTEEFEDDKDDVNITENDLEQEDMKYRLSIRQRKNLLKHIRSVSNFGTWFFTGGVTIGTPYATAADLSTETRTILGVGITFFGILALGCKGFSNYLGQSIIEKELEDLKLQRDLESQ